MSVERNQDVLVANEEPVIHWEGDIHVGEDSYGSEFVATDRRLLYNQGGMTKDIDYRHITSVEAGTEVKEEQHGTSITGAYIGSAVGIISGLLLFAFTGSFWTTILSAALILTSIASIRSTQQNPEDYGIETTKRVIHHVRLIRDNEAPLYITTGSDVGSRLRNLVAESKRNQ